MAEIFTNNNFDEQVLKSDKPVLVDFWAEWCGPCRTLAPIIEDLAKDYEGKAVVGKVNVEEDSDLASTYNIRSIPTVLLFKNGEIVEKHVGMAAASVLSEKIEAHL